MARVSPSDDDLEAVVVRRIVAAGTWPPDLPKVRWRRAVQSAGVGTTDVADVAAAVSQAQDQLPTNSAGQVAVTAYRNVGFALGQALGADAADPVGGFGGQGSWGTTPRMSVGAKMPVGKGRGHGGVMRQHSSRGKSTERRSA